MSCRAIAFAYLSLVFVACGSATIKPDGMAGNSGTDGGAGVAGVGRLGGGGHGGGVGAGGTMAGGSSGTSGASGSAGAGEAGTGGGGAGGASTGGSGGTGGVPTCGGVNQDCCAGNVCNTSSTACCGGSCVDVLSSTQHCGGACQVCNGNRPICSAGACVQCLLDSDCALSSRKTCDFNSHSCVCRRPSANNLLANPGFDTNLNGWGGILPTGEPNWVSDDADGCPESGAVHGNATGENTNLAPSQCVAVTPGTTYYFGAKFKAATMNQFLTLWYHSDANCQTYLPNGPFVQIPAVPTSWTLLSASDTPPANVHSVAIHCSIYDGEMDQIYLNPVSPSF